MKWITLALATLSLCTFNSRAAAVPGTLVFIGTYTGPKSEGIYAARFDSATGKLTAPTLAAATKNPSFIALHPNGRFLYAVGEVDNFGGKKTGAVRAFSINREDGKLTLLNEQESEGTGPCHLALDKSGNCLLVANYGSGSIAALPVGKDGKLAKASFSAQHKGSSVNPQRQAGPHAHFITTDPANRIALACDLGLDQVLAYRLDKAQTSLVANDPPVACSIKAGSGPRHLAFHPNGRQVYVINEMSSTITTLEYEAPRGALKVLQTISTLPEGFDGKNSCAELQVHRTGRFVYGSNRGHDSIAVFAVDDESGTLTPIEHQPTQGKTPRHFAIDPASQWLLVENQGSDNIVIFRIDWASGGLQPTGQKVEVGAPVCLEFLP